MLLAVDIGNTKIKIAVFKQSKCVFTSFFLEKKAKENFLKIFQEFPKITHIISSSVGKITLDKKEWFGSTEILNITPSFSFPFTNHYTTPKTLGIDRQVLVTGAIYKYPNTNILIIDAGTCITYDFVDKEKNYLGGGISPGIQLRYKSMNNYTAKLPLLNKKKPKNFIGNSTEEAIHSGVINGIALEIEGFISNYLLKFKDLTVILTGGDAIFLAKSIKSTIFANPNFLLESLNTIFLQKNK